MIVYLYDASSIVNLAKRGEVTVFAKGATIELAIYEAVNAIWKECYLLKRIKPEVAFKFVELLSKIFDVLELYSMKGFEKDIMDIALKEGITIYDAAYIHAAMHNSLTLVTDDQKLRKAASKYVNTSTSRNIS